MFAVFTVSAVPIFFANKLGMRFSPTRNRTIYGVIFSEDREAVERICISINNFFIPLGSFLIIVVCTIILTIQLHMKNKWRRTTIVAAHVDRVSNRNQRVAKMVLIISTLFIVCFAPTTVVMLAVSFLPDIRLTGKYRNFALLIAEFSSTMENVNSSMNNFIYYHMSSKYRETFLKIFSCRKWHSIKSKIDT